MHDAHLREWVTIDDDDNDDDDDDDDDEEGEQRFCVEVTSRRNHPNMKEQSSCWVLNRGHVRHEDKHRFKDSTNFKKRKESQGPQMVLGPLRGGA
jgi:alpha-tubulin suppressor-like RCC1 family protein